MTLDSEPPTNTKTLAAWLALLYAPGVGPARFVRLVEQFGAPTEVFAARRDDWAALGLPDASLDYLRAPDWNRVERDLLWLEGRNNHLINYRDPVYPSLLKQIDYFPPLLFVHGDPGILNTHQIAIVGTRNPTPTGRESARNFAAHLVEAGLAITSGLALGIDAEAHQGALHGQGRTIAVMGTGPDRIYPARHRELAHAIGEQGALVSELPPGTAPLSEHFPRRNRIISGLALGTLVVEAAAHSGSLITARLAGEQGREVFAIPGSIHNPMAKGCHALIRQGAKLVEVAADVLEELGSLAMAATTGEKEVQLAAPPLDEEYRRLLEYMGHEPVAIDMLVNRCGLTAEAVSSMLLILELRGYVAAAPGGLYSQLNI